MSMISQQEEKSILDTLKNVCEHFCIPGTIVEYRKITSGNINTTYSVVCESIQDDVAVRIPYIVQRVNQYVFNDPIRMMQNIDLVTEHMLGKNGKNGMDNRRNRLHFHHTSDRKNYYINNGEFWRLFNYVEDSIGFDTTTDPRVLYMVGKAFGQFQAQLRDFDANQLTEIIPDFHNTKKRLETFFNHVKEDSCGRCGEVQEEIAFLQSQQERCSKLSIMAAEGSIPLRVTHNDTKSNNVLLDKDSLQPLVVIDLDTVMPGLAAYDFGDAVRFAANTAEENEKDLSKVSLDLNLYRAFSEGFIEATASFMTEAELDSMALGALTLTVELASRFLDDYITGDKYFTTHYPGENLDRARCQIALAKDMLDKFDEMERIVKETSRNV
ncbi:MAG: phosphotransferase enzyme family protein [Lachnospiraceae bacterium]